MGGDTLTVEGDVQDGEALIQPIMRAGKRLAPPETIEVIRARGPRGSWSACRFSCERCMATRYTRLAWRRKYRPSRETSMRLANSARIEVGFWIMAKNTKPQHMSSGQEQLLAQALASAANAAFITDNAGRIVWINDAFSRLSGYSANEAIGHTPSFLKSERQNASFYRELWETILAGNVWRGEVVERRKDGTLYTVDEVITPLRDAGGTVSCFLAIQNDITTRKQEADRERFLAYHDALTGLPNRVFFADVLRRAIAHAESAAERVIIFFLDLDNFKPINDSLGHAVGDQLLVAVGERLNMTVRKTDVVARLGGDEFGILLLDLTDAEIAAVAQNILHRISQPFSIQSRLLHTTASIGISIYPSLGTDTEELLNKADQAMYRAKRSGRNNYQFAEIE